MGTTMVVLVWLVCLVDMGSGNVWMYLREGEDVVMERRGDTSQGCTWEFTARGLGSSYGSPWLDAGTSCCYPQSDSCSSNEDPSCREEGSFRLESSYRSCRLHLLPVRLTDVGLYTTTFIAGGQPLQTTIEMRRKMPPKQGQCTLIRL